ncbi:phage portal protein [Streptomyces sp. NP160]|uniref:phage portal protein n=1 Tax=Streptomyces sp. NP160 TaxID=2586637 RepID=UPI0015D5CADF|nr:phage portal protein [Streptomyces sp. NP160]
MSVETALSMSAVYRSVDILCTSVSQLELGVWRGISELKNVPAVVARPDVNLSLSSFLKRTVMSLAGNGNAYWRLLKDDAGAPVQNIEVLNPSSIVIGYEDGKKVYHYSGYTKPVTFQAWEIKHLKLMEVFGSDYGLGPIQAVRVELRGALEMRKYADNWFTEGSIPTGVLAAKDYIDGEQADEYRKRWEANQAKRGVAVLGNGMTYSPILLSPADAQFLENQAFTITQIARLFGIPANYLLAEINGNAMTYQNMEQVDTAFLKYTLTAYLREIEEAFTDVLPRGQRARFKVQGFLRADDRTRADVHEKYKNMGVLTTEEIRISEGWGPMPDELKNMKPTPAPGMPVQEESTEDNG